jgi:Protein of unknown function (DUF1349)
MFCAVCNQLLLVPGLPFPFKPSSRKRRRVDEAAGVVMLSGGPHADIFIDPDGTARPAGREPECCAERGVNAQRLGWAMRRGRPSAERPWVSRVGLAHAHHASLDGKAWRMIRVFVLSDQTSRDRIGFEGQSPTGDGCGVTFDAIRFLPERLADPRDGS